MGHDYPAESVGRPFVVPVEEQLRKRRAMFMEQVNDIDKALNALEKNPQVLDILNLMRKIGV